MDPIHKRINIGGMTCVNCQSRIEKALSSLDGVENVNVSYKDGTAEFTYDPDAVSYRVIKDAVEKLDYEVLPDENRPDIVRTVSLLVIIIALFVIIRQFGLLNLLVPGRLAENGMGYPMLFVVGLLTSVHCIAMCGGINLSQCIPQSAENAGKEKFSFLPSAFYNLGRVVSYTVIGALLGFVGMILGGGGEAGIPVLLQGILKMIAGAVMVIMGINMLGLFPCLRRLSPKMPGFISKKIGMKKATERRPFVVGLLNGLMPCGPLQSMQILALASASPLTGALSMFMFSLGTVPLMLGLGSAVAAIGRKFARAVTSVGAVLVAVLGLAMLSQGGSLSGMLLPDRLLFIVCALAALGIAASIPVSRKVYRAASIALSVVLVFTVGFVLARFDKGDTAATGQMIYIENGVQMVDSTLLPGQYPTIVVQAGMPVKWTIHASEGSINGCNYKMIISRYGIEYSFEEGENVIKFTPTETGTFQYTCWMGMISGSIIVTE